MKKKKIKTNEWTNELVFVVISIRFFVRLYFLLVAKNSFFALEILLRASKLRWRRKNSSSSKTSNTATTTHMYKLRSFWHLLEFRLFSYVTHRRTDTKPYVYALLIRMIVCDRVPHLHSAHTLRHTWGLIHSTIRRITRCPRFVYLFHLLQNQHDRNQQKQQQLFSTSFEKKSNCVEWKKKERKKNTNNEEINRHWHQHKT